MKALCFVTDDPCCDKHCYWISKREWCSQHRFKSKISKLHSIDFRGRLWNSFLTKPPTMRARESGTKKGRKTVPFEIKNRWNHKGVKSEWRAESHKSFHVVGESAEFYWLFNGFCLCVYLRNFSNHQALICEFTHLMFLANAFNGFQLFFATFL